MHLAQTECAVAVLWMQRVFPAMAAASSIVRPVNSSHGRFEPVRRFSVPARQMRIGAVCPPDFESRSLRRAALVSDGERARWFQATITATPVKSTPCTPATPGGLSSCPRRGKRKRATASGLASTAASAGPRAPRKALRATARTKGQERPGVSDRRLQEDAECAGSPTRTNATKSRTMPPDSHECGPMPGGGLFSFQHVPPRQSPPPRLWPRKRASQEALADGETEPQTVC